MNRFIKFVLLFFFLIIPFFKNNYVLSVEICGEASYTWVTDAACVSASAPACNPPKNKTTLNCWIEDGRCITRYAWTGCYDKYNPYTGGYICEPEHNYVLIDCDAVGPPGGGNSYEYTRCPDGQYISCGTDQEAEEQNKHSCTYRITCNKHYWPSLIKYPIPCGNNEAHATCNWNCSCCPIGTSRTCTIGSRYTMDITVDLANEGGAALWAKKTTCDTHNDIFISNQLLREYENKWGEKFQDWRLFCQEQNCACRALPTSTPTETPPTPTKTPIPTLTPTAFIRIRTYDPDLNPITYPNNIYKAACPSAPCFFPSSTNNVAVANFSGAEANRGGGINAGTYTVAGVTPYLNNTVSNTGLYSPDCRGATGNRHCYYWTSALTTGRRELRFILISATPSPTPTTGAGPWVKLKNTSYYSSGGLLNQIPATPVSYDADDSPANTQFIRDNGGLVAASSINLGVGMANSTNRSVSYATSNPPSLTPESYLSYVKARKQYTKISAIGQIDTDGIYLYQQGGTLTLNNTSLAGAAAANFVLIVDGNVTINQDRFNLGADCLSTASSKSIAILSTGTMTFSNTTQCAVGIFVASDVSSGTTTNQGLKIIGNLVAQNSLTNNRKWTDLNMPSLFVVFNKDNYLNLLPYMGTVNYEWNQTQ